MRNPFQAPPLRITPLLHAPMRYFNITGERHTSPTLRRDAYEIAADEVEEDAHAEIQTNKTKD